EGGNLAAGVPNRIYFRVRDSHGQPADLAGRIVDGRGREIVAVQTMRGKDRPPSSRGLGVFSLTPAAGEHYQFITTELAGAGSPTPLPDPRSDSLALHVANAVSNEGDPIQVVLNRGGPARSLVIAVFSRDRLVSHESITVPSGMTEHRIALPKE